MTTHLKSALREMMRNWKQDLTQEWRTVMGSVNPNLDAVNSRLTIEDWEPIFPARKRVKGADPEREAQKANRLLGTDRNAHLLRAFDNVKPAKVKAVIVGQDPYPHITRATGRAFEAADLTSWHQYVASSLQGIIRAVAFAQTERKSYLKQGDATWDRIVDEIDDGTLEIPERPNKLFDRWEKSGVMWLNTGLTLTRYKRGGHAHQLEGHIPYWRPVIERVVHFLAERDRGAVVFVLWGSPAKRFFADSGIEDRARAAGTWKTRVRAVRNRHPSTDSFLTEPNPFLAVNQALSEMGASPIRW